MVDRALFMEALRSVQEIAKASAGPMAREEIKEYFKDMELSPEQQEMVYQYLVKAIREGCPAEGTGHTPAEDGAKKPAGGKKAGYSRHFQMYLKEVSSIKGLPEGRKLELYQKLLAGERAAVSEISTQWLKRVAEIAGEYVTNRVLVEDLAQEGNMGLLLGLETMLGAKGKYGDLESGCCAIEQKLEFFVREAMEQYQRETEGIDSRDNTILAKVNLIHEAQKALAEDTGTIPALQELSEYTKIPVEEVRDIMALSKEKGEGL